MPSWNSHRGKWLPKKEETYIDYSRSKFRHNRGKKGELYSGPDRAAQQQLNEAGLEYLGQDVTEDPQLLEVAQKHNLTIDEYLKRFQPSEKQKAIKRAEDDKVADHSDPTPKRGVRPHGGGVTMTGALSEHMPA